jgi:phage tail-like protein
MATLPGHPYAQFNFLVDFSTGGPGAGFQECSGLDPEATAAESRAGHDMENRVRKITGQHKATNLTLKRGVIRTPDFYQWLEDTRDGKPGASRTVIIRLQNEERTAIGRTWKFARARIIKHVSGPLNAKGTDVAMEELTLSHEGLEME